MREIGKKNLLEADDALINTFKIAFHDGYETPFTRNQYPGALSNGSRVVKTWEDKGGDLRKVGSEGTILGSMGHPDLGVGYFVEWDDVPTKPSLVFESKLKAIP